MIRYLFAATLASAVLPAALLAQHEGHGTRRETGPLPAQAGQDAFAAISELVAILESDPTTNWKQVDLEAVRRHLVDMNNVVLRSSPRMRPVEGGAVFDIVSPTAIQPAVRRMITMHAVELNRMPAWRATVEVLTTETRLTVVATTTGDVATMARIRGLGFIGLLATGDHHRAHHLAMARGQTGAQGGNHH